MHNTPECKQDASRHFDLKPLPQARSSTFLFGKDTKSSISKNPALVPSRHISRKDLFYGLHLSSNDLPLKKTVLKTKKDIKKDNLTFKNIKITHKNMHPEEVQLSASVEALVKEKISKHQEVAEEDIDVEEVDNGDLVQAANDDFNGNGFHLEENGHSDQFDGNKDIVSPEDKVIYDSNGASGPDMKSISRLKSPRRNSTSSRSSSVSTAPSVKQITTSALQMEVSMDEEGKDHMEPLILEGMAEDLEVSMSASHDDGENEANSVTTDSEAMEINQDVDVYDFVDEDGDQDFDAELLSKKSKGMKSNKPAKALKSPPKPKSAAKSLSRTYRNKAYKTKDVKQSSKVVGNVDDLPYYDELKNTDSDSVSKDGSVIEDLNVKSLKSPSKRQKSSKQDHVGDAEVDEKADSEHVPRRSSRPRHTPQKYNSSLYVDSAWDFSGTGDDRLNNSDAAFGASIRSVKGRRSLRKSRNISALNASLHDESSPWDNEFKVLTPSGGGLSVHVDDKVDSSTPLKRKASDDDDVEKQRGQKKMCVENADLDISTSSQSSSFFSVITSPILLLKNKFRGSSTNSTPTKIDVKDDAEYGGVLQSTSATEAEATVSAETPAVEVAQEARSWCIIM